MLLNPSPAGSFTPSVKYLMLPTVELTDSVPSWAVAGVTASVSRTAFDES